MPGKYAEYLEGDVFEQAMRGHKEMQVRMLAIAQNCRIVDPETSDLLMAALANADMPEAHNKLSRLYLGGDPTLGADAERAFHHLASAAGLGDVSAMAQLGAVYEGRERGYLGGTAGYQIQIDLDEAIKWYRSASDLGNAWSREILADLLLAGRRARDCSGEEQREIESLYEASGKYFKLGSMYCVDKGTGDCIEEEINTAKKWYQKGRESKYPPCPECTDILRLWNEPEHAPPLKNTPWTLIGIFASAIGLILCAVAGTFLLGFAISITSATLPLIIIGAVLFAIYRSFKSR